MLQFYQEQKGEMVLWNPIMVTLLTTISLVSGIRAYSGDDIDCLLFLQFSFTLLTLWRCLTISPKTELSYLPGTKTIRIEMEGFIPIALTLFICIVHGCLLLVGYRTKPTLDSPSFILRITSIFIFSGKNDVVEKQDLFWCAVDFVLLIVLCYLKLTYKLTYNHHEFRQLRKIYKKMNIIFKVVSYSFLAYSSISNPVYIFIVYLALKQQISTTKYFVWANTSNLIGLMRYLTLASFILTAIQPPCLYLFLGSHAFKSVFENNELPKASILSLLFFLASHMCVYTNDLCLLLPKVEFKHNRNCVYPTVEEFEGSYFHKYLLCKWMRIMDSSHFALVDNYYNQNINSVQAAFQKDKLIGLHIERLMLKQDSNTYRWLSRLLVRVFFPLLRYLIPASV